MSSGEMPPLSMSEDGLRIAIEPADPGVREADEALIRASYARCHPGDSLDELRHRARFSKEAQGLLRDWMRIAVQLARQRHADADRSAGNSSG